MLQNFQKVLMILSDFDIGTLFSLRTFDIFLSIKISVESLRPLKEDSIDKSSLPFFQESG